MTEALSPSILGHEPSYPREREGVRVWADSLTLWREPRGVEASLSLWMWLWLPLLSFAFALLCSALLCFALLCFVFALPLRSLCFPLFCFAFGLICFDPGTHTIPKGDGLGTWRLESYIYIYIEAIDRGPLYSGPVYSSPV